MQGVAHVESELDSLAAMGPVPPVAGAEGGADAFAATAARAAAAFLLSASLICC